MNWVTIAQLAVAGGTIILAVVTVWAILNTNKWNRRNERMRLMPFVRLELLGSGWGFDLLDSKPGWFQKFYLKATNVGIGPIVFQRIRASQGNNEFRITSVRKSRIQEEDPSWLLPVGEEQILRLEIKEPYAIQEGDPPPIRLLMTLYDVFGKAVRIDYELEHPEQGEGLFNVESVNISGFKKRIPIQNKEATCQKSPRQNS
ncbi:hypothetical protein KAX06_09045 [candidate division WOR-3 bacterium]|nr:hypothetical protein [candidate division WOR-3 bacterium]